MNPEETIKMTFSKLIKRTITTHKICDIDKYMMELSEMNEERSVFFFRYFLSLSTQIGVVKNCQKFFQKSIKMFKKLRTYVH